MTDASHGGMIAALLTAIVLSAFFAATETALMSINRYRLRHRAKQGHAAARLTEALLARPDRLIGVVLLGSTLANVAAASIVTVLTLERFGEQWLALANGALTLLLLIVCEVGPKTYGALHPERLALPSAYIYRPLQVLTYPVVVIINGIANALLRLLGVSADAVASHSLSADELRTVVAEAGALIPSKHQQMLVGILDLEQIEVEEIMIPRADIVGIDLDGDWEEVLDRVRDGTHTRLPVYEGDLDHIVGILHMKRVAAELAHGDLTRERLISLARLREPYYIPEGTTLTQQLVAFQQNHRRHAFVVDEYGDLIGLVTLEDILEEIVGEFTSMPDAWRRDVHADEDGSFVAAGTTTVRTLNRVLGLGLETSGPRTLNGLVLEVLETIPDPGTTFRHKGHTFEVLNLADNQIRTVRIRPRRAVSLPTTHH